MKFSGHSSQTLLPKEAHHYDQSDREVRGKLLLATLSQIGQIVPILGVFMLSQNILLAYSVLIPLTLLLVSLNLELQMRYDRSVRHVSAARTEYLFRFLPRIVLEVVTISVLIPLIHFTPIYFGKYTDFAQFIIYYLVLVAIVFLSSPLQALFSQRMSRVHPDISKRFALYSKQLGLGRVEVFSVPWSRFKIANAFQMGPLLNYRVYITDYLIDNLSQDELDFVILHELYHAKRKHILKIMLLFTFLIFLLYTVSYVPFYLVDNLVIQVALLLIYMYFLLTAFPLLLLLYSRHNETEADLNAVKYTTNPTAAISALEKLSELNALPTHISKYRLLQSHPPVSVRIKRIEELGI